MQLSLHGTPSWAINKSREQVQKEVVIKTIKWQKKNGPQSVVERTRAAPFVIHPQQFYSGSSFSDGE